MQDDKHEITERDAIPSVNKADIIMRTREYNQRIKTALRIINGRKIYGEGVDYRKCTREQFVRGELDKHIDWEKTDQDRILQMKYLPEPPYGYSYEYNYQNHKAECKPVKHIDIEHQRTRRTLQKNHYGKNYIFRKNESS